MLSNPTILVCTDFSVYSDRAIEAASKIAKKTNGEVYVIHVAEVGFYLEWGAYGIKSRSIQEEFVNIVNKDISRRIQDQLSRCNASAQAIVTISGTAEEGITKTLIEKKADLLVIGSRGASNKLEFVIGSLTKKMVASSPVPVLVVKQEFELNKVAGLVDNSDSMHEVLDRSQEIAYLFSSELEVISLWQDISYSAMIVNALHPDNQAMLAKIRERIKTELKGHDGIKLHVETTREKNIAAHLVELLIDGKFDLAIMKRHRKTMIERFFIGSETSRVLDLFEGNLLICPPDKE